MTLSRAHQPIEAGDNHHVTGDQSAHKPAKLAPAIGRLARPLLAEYQLATGGLQSLNLQGVVLVGGGDPRVTVPHGDSPDF